MYVFLLTWCTHTQAIKKDVMLAYDTLDKALDLAEEAGRSVCVCVCVCVCLFCISEALDLAGEAGLFLSVWLASGVDFF
jgi:hypothetical protein